MRYKTIYADPPWAERGAGQCKRGADKHYRLMDTDEIIELMSDIPLDDNSHLYLWVTNNFIPDGLRVIESLGFTYITMITWAKDKIGIGQYFRGQTEHCMFARKGQPGYKKRPDGSRIQFSTLLETDRFFELTRTHSRKPEKMRRWIEMLSFEPRIEVFSRVEIDGWDVIGDQIKTINL